MEFSLVKKIFLTLGCLILVSCQSNKDDFAMQQALRLAGDNKAELENVIKHYENDRQKLEATQFLIRNMIGFSSKGQQLLEICKPFYQEYDSLANLYEYEMNTERGKKIDSLWSNFSNNHHQLRTLPNQLDIKNISAEQLIAEIDLAFKAWQENVYTRNSSFEEFCEYILPYRRINGLIIDNARTNFYERHKGKYFTHYGKDMMQEADSLLYEYKHLTHSKFWGTQIPILNAETLENMHNGLCEDRCWYNSLLFSSLGMAVGIDFVPAWGNRNSSHTWNVLIKDGESYPFEPFWDEDRWKYKRIYNNKTFDIEWGRFRLAKVYRNSFKNFVDGPITDKRINEDDIPDLFKNFKKKDVSSEYFDTVNVTIPLKDIPKDAHYAYLCVWNFNKWQPVQWGKIEKNNVTFMGMGKDVLYLPCYYKNRSLVYAGEPFLLNQTGKFETFSSNLNNVEDLYIKQNRGETFNRTNRWNNIYIRETIVTGSKTPLFEKSDTLCIFPDSLEMYNKKLTLFAKKPIRYLRVSLPHQKIAFSDLSFYYKDNRDNEKKIEDVKLLHALDSTENGEHTAYMFDKFKATGYKRDLKQEYIAIDLGKEYAISSINFSPYVEPGLYRDIKYELFYWNNGWQSLKIVNGADKHVVFKDVPKNALFILKDTGGNYRLGPRPFIYRNNEVLWH